MQKGNIGVTTENIFPVIKKFLYSDHEIFLRELISNAVDATQKLKTYAERGDFKGDLGDLSVRVTLNKDKGTLTISDRGVGMTAEEIDRYIRDYQPFDKAGAYGIQEWIGYIGVTNLEGSFYNVMGLPVQRIYEEMKLL